AGSKRTRPTRVATRPTADVGRVLLDPPQTVPSDPPHAVLLDPPSKLRYATIAAAALAHIVSRQGDAIGFAASGRDDVFVGARAGRPHLRRVLAALASLEAGGAWAAGASIRRAAERLSRRGLLLVFSDCYDDEESVFGELRRAAHMGHDVALFHVLSRAEIEFPY